MSRTSLLCVGVSAAIILSSGCSKAERTDPRSTKPPAVGTGGAGSDVKSDDDFVRDVAVKNMAEIELSRMAAEKAATPQIKAFAQHMIADHDAAGTKLKNAVLGTPMNWPAELDDNHRESVEELAKKQGADFDREYVKAMIEGHQDLAAKLESRLDVKSLEDWKTAAAARAQSKTLPDPKTEMRDVEVRPNKSDNAVTMKINQWAAEIYPVVQKHLDTARALENAATKR